MNSETVVRNEVTGWGQHWVEVLRMGAEVNRERWLEAAPQGAVPAEAMHLVRWGMRHEAGMDVWRLLMRWPAREWVKLDEQLAKEVGRSEVVLWYIEDQTIREAAARAAWVWRRRRAEDGAKPERVLVAKLPSGAPGEFELEELEKPVRVRMEAAAWVPKGYLVMV